MVSNIIISKLSESFIKEFNYKINWKHISSQYKLSESFIRKFKNKVDWECIERYQNIKSFSNEFKQELVIRKLK